MFDWNDLRYFLAMAREGSTLSAAKALGVSQPTVQRRLSALEASIDRRLVEHHPTGYRLTDFGRTLLPHAEDIERSVMAFQRKSSSGGQEVSGTLLVTCPEGMASRLLAPLIEAFRTRYPELRVDLIMTDRRLDLSKGEVDVAIRMHEPGEESLVARKIADAPWAVYASRAYVQRHGSPQRIEDLDHHAIVEFTGEIDQIHAGRWLRSAALQATIAARANSMLGVLEAVKSGAGLAPLPVLLAGGEDDLVSVLGPLPQIGSRIYLVMHSDLRRAVRVRAFCDFVAAEIGRFRPRLAGEQKKVDSDPGHEI